MRWFACLAFCMASACAKGPTAEPAAVSADASSCRLSEAELLANRQLDWRAFDQSAQVRSSWRALVERGCHEEAVRAYTDYLAYGPVPDGERWQTTARFHLGQSLAHVGRYQEAAQVIATARRQTEIGDMRWNIYVQGTYAFLTRDKAGLLLAFETLRTQPEHSNAVNAGVLAGLFACWERPYHKASAPACVAASGYSAPSD